eukprot:569645-Prorocentrum_minimum.AAC.6
MGCLPVDMYYIKANLQDTKIRAIQYPTKKLSHSAQCLEILSFLGCRGLQPPGTLTVGEDLSPHGQGTGGSEAATTPRKAILYSFQSLLQRFKFEVAGLRLFIAKFKLAVLKHLEGEHYSRGGERGCARGMGGERELAWGSDFIPSADWRCAVRCAVTV